MIESTKHNLREALIQISTALKVVEQNPNFVAVYEAIMHDNEFLCQTVKSPSELKQLVYETLRSVSAKIKNSHRPPILIEINHDSSVVYETVGLCVHDGQPCLVALEQGSGRQIYAPFNQVTRMVQGENEYTG